MKTAVAACPDEPERRPWTAGTIPSTSNVVTVNNALTPPMATTASSAAWTAITWTAQ